ncbi:MAG: hypothetical protein OEW21_02805 [Betaproteobacteria bacterium]|nr:hypothetical protein [Betaproteobacteria bacterium]
MGAARPVVVGALAAAALLAAYFLILSLASGSGFALTQLREFWFYVVPLAAGFGVQIGLFVHLRRLVGATRGSGTVVTASGTTSTAAMISCCAHYLANVAPVIGATGLVTFAAQYQVEFFWVGLAFNLAGIAFIGNKVLNATKDHAQCAAA